MLANTASRPTPRANSRSDKKTRRKVGPFHILDRVVLSGKRLPSGLDGGDFLSRLDPLTVRESKGHNGASKR